MIVGVDFDNTIVCYDTLFHRIAVEQSLVPAELPATKGQVRDYLRRQGQEEAWTELQGYVYGARMQEAAAFDGVLEFFASCRARGIRVHIISHKTRHPFLGPQYDLHQAAHQWLESQGFYDHSRIGLAADQVHLELTKQEKLARIAAVDCSHFIDDLPEFLTEETFPAGVERLLFDPSKHHAETANGLCCVNSWAELKQRILGS